MYSAQSSAPSSDVSPGHVDIIPPLLNYLNISPQASAIQRSASRSPEPPSSGVGGVEGGTIRLSSLESKSLQSFQQLIRFYGNNGLFKHFVSLDWIDLMIFMKLKRGGGGEIKSYLVLSDCRFVHY